MVVGVVNVDDVDAIEAEALEALAERTERTVVGEVEDRLERQRALVRRVRLATGAEHAPDLRREHELATWAPAEGVSEAALRETGSVERGRVEEAEPVLPRPVHDRTGVGVGNRLEETADRRAAESELGDGQPGAAEANACRRVHRLIIANLRRA